jgi:hypothetical protein
VIRILENVFSAESVTISADHCATALLQAVSLHLMWLMVQAVNFTTFYATG